MRLAFVVLTFGVASAACIPVAGDKIRASDLARALPEFSLVAPDEFIGFAPVPGYQRVISSQQLKTIGARHGIDLSPAAEACFERESEVLTNERVHDATVREFNSTGITIQVIDVSRHPVPKGSLVFPLTGLPRPVAGDCTPELVWKGHVRDESGHLTPVWAKVQIFEEREQTVVTSPIAAGQIITPESVGMQTVKCFPFPAAVAKVADVIGKVARVPLHAGQAIAYSHVKARPDVNRGETVQVTVISSAMRLSFAAEAQSTGAKGQSITLRNPWNNQDFRAVVDGPGRSRIEVR
jgi:flagella basal body P-ring formation protein FlgA